MNKMKSLYEAPTTDVLVVRFEESLLTLSNNVNSVNHTQYLIGGADDDYEEL